MTRTELDVILKKRGARLEHPIDDFRREGEITAPLLARRRTES